MFQPTVGGDRVAAGRRTLPARPNPFRTIRAFAALIATWPLFTAPAHGQFTTVINVPPDVAPSFITSNTQLNLFDGGEIANLFSAGAFDGTSENVEVNIGGGTVGNFFAARGGSVVNISGGMISDFVDAYEGSVVNVRGGAIGDRFDTFAGSSLNLFGGEFRVDGAPVAGLEKIGNAVPLNLGEQSVLSGTLADGSTFAFSAIDFDFIAGGTLTLITAELPEIESPVVTLPTDPLPRGIRTGQSLIVRDGGVVGDNFNADWGSAVAIHGGQVGMNFEAVGARVTITGGSVDTFFEAFQGSIVNILGGTVGNDFNAYHGSVVNITGGSVGGGFDAEAGSVVNITGGDVGGGFQAIGNSIVNISGGRVGRGLASFPGSQLNISGGKIGEIILVTSGSEMNISGGAIGRSINTFEDCRLNVFGGDFRLNGAPIDGLTEIGNSMQVDLLGRVLSGLLADGTPFVFSNLMDDLIDRGTLTLNVIELPPVGPAVIEVPDDAAPLGIRRGQTLLLRESGQIRDNFTAYRGSVLVMSAEKSVIFSKQFMRTSSCLLVPWATAPSS